MASLTTSQVSYQTTYSLTKQKKQHFMHEFLFSVNVIINKCEIYKNYFVFIFVFILSIYFTSKVFQRLFTAASIYLINTWAFFKSFWKKKTEA